MYGLILDAGYIADFQPRYPAGNWIIIQPNCLICTFRFPFQPWVPDFVLNDICNKFDKISLNLDIFLLVAKLLYDYLCPFVSPYVCMAVQYGKRNFLGP